MAGFYQKYFLSEAYGFHQMYMDRSVSCRVWHNLYESVRHSQSERVVMVLCTMPARLYKPCILVNPLILESQIMSDGNSTHPNSATSKLDRVYTTDTVYTFHGDVSATYADRRTDEEIPIDPSGSDTPLTPGSQDPFDEYYVKYWHITPRGQRDGGSAESKRYNDFFTQSHGTTLDLEYGQTTKLSNGKVVYPFKVVHFPISLEDDTREVHNLDSVPTEIHLYCLY